MTKRMRRPEPDEEDRKAAFIILTARAFKARLTIGEIRHDLFCPLCGSSVAVSRANGNGHLRIVCPTEDCLRLIE